MAPFTVKIWLDRYVETMTGNVLYQSFVVCNAVNTMLACNVPMRDEFGIGPFKIRIVSVENPAVKDESDNFFRIWGRI